MSSFDLTTEKGRKELELQNSILEYEAEISKNEAATRAKSALTDKKRSKEKVKVRLAKQAEKKQKEVSASQRPAKRRRTTKEDEDEEQAGEN